MPKLPDRGERGGDLRDLLSLEEGVHRRECLAREALWEAQVFQALAAADVVSGSRICSSSSVHSSTTSSTSRVSGGRGEGG